MGTTAHFVFHSVQFMSTTLSVDGFPMQDGGSDFLHGGGASQSIGISFSVLFIFSLLGTNAGMEELAFADGPSSGRFC